MTQRRTSLPLLVVVAAGTLVLGSFGTAAAGPALAKGQVRKIAATVVRHAAPKLSVAKASEATHATSATTASNATNLAGKGAPSYLTTSFQYRLPVQAAALNRFYSFPGLPDGTYSFTYDAILTGASTATYCEMRPTFAYLGTEGYAHAPANGFGVVTGSGIVTFVGGAVNFHCGGSEITVYNGPEVNSSVTFTRVDSLTSGTATSP